jgi:hypothetical protein
MVVIHGQAAHGSTTGPMAMTGATDGAFAILHLEQLLELSRLAPHFPKLLKPIELVQATSALVLATE